MNGAYSKMHNERLLKEGFHVDKSGKESKAQHTIAQGKSLISQGLEWTKMQRKIDKYAARAAQPKITRYG